MQTYSHVMWRIPLRPNICSKVSSSSITTLRTFFACSIWSKSSEHLELPNDSAVSTEPELSNRSKSPKDPELQKKRKHRYINAWRRNKYATDPIWREQRLAEQSAYQRNRRVTDQEWRNLTVERDREYHQLKMNTDSGFAIAKVLRNWVYHKPSIREKLSWKTHIPILTQEKLEGHCASCGVKRRGGLKLFWQRRRESQTGEHLYDCSPCFMKSTATFLPEGFEDVQTLEQLHDRREQLLGVKFRQPRRKTASSASSPPST